MILERKYPLMFNAVWDDITSTSSGCHTKTEYKYIATDGKHIYGLGEKKYSSDFARLNLDEPKLQVSHFEGCPHYYGNLFMPNGDGYEIQCKITKEYLEEAHQMRGDWAGYKEGQYTRRFLDKASLMSAFELLKQIVQNN